ncbi:formylglycine-generating enzyme family protein [Deltaproteobacteria bacterium TL4]
MKTSLRLLFILCVGWVTCNTQVVAQTQPSVPQAIESLAEDLLTQLKSSTRVKPLIVVLDIINLENKQRDVVSQKLEALFIQALLDAQRSVVDFQEISKVRQEWLEAFPKASGSELSHNLSGLVGADWTVSGTYTISQETIDITLQLYEFLSDQVLWKASRKSKFSIEDSLPMPAPSPAPIVAEPSSVSSEKPSEATETSAVVGLMVLVPQGRFMMGSNLGKTDSKPAHEVYVKSFRMDIHEVTNEAYSQCKECERGHGMFDTTEAQQPVVFVDWENAKKYCESLQKRLPTEAEWEKAARAGSRALYAFGNDPADLEKYAWYETTTVASGEPYAHRVATKQPNALGLYDPHGNVMEWVSDWYAPDYFEKGENTNPQGPQRPSEENSLVKTVKGGAWGGAFGVSQADGLRSAQRFAYPQWVRSFNIGFRCAADVDSSTEKSEDDAETHELPKALLEEKLLPSVKTLPDMPPAK